MPIDLPQFDPAQAPSTVAQIGLQGQNDSQSWMDQAQNRQIQQVQSNIAQAQAQRQQQIFALNLPALVAKSQADTLGDQNDAQSALLQQQLRGQWQTMKPQVIADLGSIEDPANQKTEADGTPDWTAKYNAYEALQAKYGALSLLPEGKQYYQMIDEGKKNAFNMALQHTMAQMTLNKLELANQNRLSTGIGLQNNQAQVNAATKPAVAQTEANNQMRNKAFTDIASQRDNLSQMGYSISNLSGDIDNEQSSGLGSGPITGSSIFGLVRPSVQQVGKDIGDFSNRIMSTVKNIRNINEFNAVTASIPKPTDFPEVQNQKIRKMQIINQVMTQRNDLQEQLLRNDPNLTPDEADKQAQAKVPFPAAVMGGAGAPAAASAPAGGAAQQLSPDQAANLPAGTHFIGTDGIERVKN